MMSTERGLSPTNQPVLRANKFSRHAEIREVRFPKTFYSEEDTCLSTSPRFLQHQFQLADDTISADAELSIVENNINASTCCHQSRKRSTFAAAVNKHLVSLFAIARFSSPSNIKKQDASTSSCPNLINRQSHPFRDKTKCITFRASDSQQELKTRKPVNPNYSPTNRLKVPDIFTTSFTHSKPHQIEEKKSSSSLANIQDSSLSHKNSLRLTISLPLSANEDSQKPTTPNSSNMFHDDYIAQITDYMFIGSIESAYNERKLCQLDIESLIDISNRNERQIPSNKKTQCPCLCQMDFRHFRSRLIISVEDSENEDIEQYFDEVNRFIEGARRCSKKILIYSYEGKSRAAAFAVQYMMSFENLLLRQVYSLLKKQRPQVAINAGFQKTLENLEKRLFPDAKPSVPICNEYLNVADPQAIKCAWIDC